MASLYTTCHTVTHYMPPWWLINNNISATFRPVFSRSIVSRCFCIHSHDYQHFYRCLCEYQWQWDRFVLINRAIKPRKTNLQWHQPKWQHQCSLKHFPWLCVAQMESPSQGRKSGLPAQLLAKACASSNFSLFGHFCAPEAAMPTFPGAKKKHSFRPGKLQHNREGPSRGLRST